MEELIKLLRQLPNPIASWMAIEAELLAETDFYLLGGAILQTVPELLRGDEQVVQVISDLSKLMLDRFDRLYKDEPAEWNNHRLAMRESVMGWLSLPKSVQFPTAVRS